MEHTFKKHMTADGFKVGYYVDNNFQKFVNADKPQYLEWLKSNDPEIIPYEPPPPPPEIPIETLRQKVQSNITGKRASKLSGGFEVNGLNISTDPETREFILGGARKAKKNSSFEIEAVMGNGSVQLLNNQMLKDLEDAFDAFGTKVHESYVADYKKSLAASRKQLEYYLANGEFE